MLSQYWVQHILGLLVRLCRPSAWSGTDDEVYDAVNYANAMIADLIDDYLPPAVSSMTTFQTGIYELSTTFIRSNTGNWDNVDVGIADTFTTTEAGQVAITLSCAAGSNNSLGELSLVLNGIRQGVVTTKNIESLMIVGVWDNIPAGNHTFTLEQKANNGGFVNVVDDIPVVWLIRHL